MSNTVRIISSPRNTDVATAYVTKLFGNSSISEPKLVARGEFSTTVSTTKGNVPLLFRLGIEAISVDQLQPREQVVFVYNAGDPTDLYVNLPWLSALEKNARVYTVAVTSGTIAGSQLGNMFLDSVVTADTGDNLLQSVVRYILRSENVHLDIYRGVVPRPGRVTLPVPPVRPPAPVREATPSPPPPVEERPRRSPGKVVITGSEVPHPAPVEEKPSPQRSNTGDLVSELNNLLQLVSQLNFKK